MDPRITTREVKLHTTPDGKSFEDPKAAERHMAHLDEQAREKRVREGLESLFWDSGDLQGAYDHEAERFVEEAYRFLEERLPLVRMLAPHLDAIVALWEAAPEPVPAENAPSSKRSKPR